MNRLDTIMSTMLDAIARHVAEGRAPPTADEAVRAVVAVLPDATPTEVESAIDKLHAAAVRSTDTANTLAAMFTLETDGMVKN
jgi:hypothetical protein